MLVRDLDPAAPLFDRTDKDRSFVPTNFRTFAARSGGQGRPNGRRDSALPLTPASPAVSWRLIGTMLAGVAVLSSPVGALAAPRLPSAAPAPVDSWIAEAAGRFGIPQSWIRNVMGVESAFRAHAVSRVGAMGLMQVMPGTYADLRARYGLGADPYHPRDNILAGAAYLREMYDRFGAGGFLAAYNAGPGRYEQHLIDGRPLPAETRAYVATLAGRLDIAAPTAIGAASIAPRPTLFAPVGGESASATAPPFRASASAGAAAGGLFVALTPTSEPR